MSDLASPLAPRLLTQAADAAHCSLTESGFDDGLKRGLLPKALERTRRWDRVAIDIAIEPVGD